MLNFQRKIKVRLDLKLEFLRDMKEETFLSSQFSRNNPTYSKRHKEFCFVFFPWIGVLAFSSTFLCSKRSLKHFVVCLWDVRTPKEVLRSVNADQLWPSYPQPEHSPVFFRLRTYGCLPWRPPVSAKPATGAPCAQLVQLGSTSRRSAWWVVTHSRKGVCQYHCHFLNKKKRRI